jgi:alanyl-tRNA synthetase
MDSALIRQTFLDFFKNKGHEIVTSSPMVMKDDPTLMFTNAGMNQFKDFFLGNRKAKNLRVADTQKCLRVSGKHNDLEEVGVDTYHHTMFEMLGNWSFGDYFKEEAISWAYELLVGVYGINKEDLYVTYFGGDKKDGLEADNESRDIWRRFFSDERILSYGKKDNFWEMGETGPCGPCTEIHVDIRSAADKKKINGKDLVNQSHAQVIEIWNLVFIQFNRNKDQSLHELPNKHVDTGMGFERLAMVLQGKQSNYDTDIFMTLIRGLEKECGKEYKHTEQLSDVAFRVIVDHVRAVSMAIAEGQLPSNTGAGYVIRRILRRAIRYAYSYLNMREPVIYKLVPLVDDKLGLVFPELRSQVELVQKVIREEEDSFLGTLEKGIERFEKYLESKPKTEEIDGKFAFELYDTYGFPLDLTELMAVERKIKKGVNKAEFNKNLKEQKDRSRAATKVDTGDWTVLLKDDVEEFVGYDLFETDVYITRHRRVKQKDAEYYHLVFNITPFYAESGGQVGDTGFIENGSEKVEVLDTKKENNIIIHVTKKLPVDVKKKFTAKVDHSKRLSTRKNHSATHLLHHALREILGKHIEQKGSLVHPDYLRFDFSHYEKVSDKDLVLIEKRVNEMVRENLALEENRSVPIGEAKKLGAMALFGEKYGDLVRVIQFGESIELCGGIHVPNTSEIGHFKIVSEGSISAGIRRIEAITGTAADNHINAQLKLIDEVRTLLKNPADIKVGLSKLLADYQKVQKELESIKKSMAAEAGKELENTIESIGHSKFLAARVEMDADSMRALIFNFVKKHPSLIVALASVSEGKVIVSIGLGEEAVKNGKVTARGLIKEISSDIQGGGGGQDHFATAGGKNAEGLESALIKLRKAVEQG